MEAPANACYGVSMTEPVTDPTSFGANLRRLRLSQNLTQEFLSHRAGVHWTLPGQVERGERNPTLKTILLLAKGLAVHPSELFLTPKETGTGDPAMINLSRPEMSPAIAEAMKVDKGSFTRTLTNDA